MSIFLPLKKALLETMLATTLCLLTTKALAFDIEYTGKVGIEGRYFVEKGQYTDQLEHTQSSIVIEPELYWSSNDGSSSVTFKPFYRIDSEDDERTHGDIRELSYIYASDSWEIRAGIRKEFWGVTEFQHLVDVVNQTDSVEDFDGEDKLGQLMLNFSSVHDWGIVDLFVLPGFRERTFSGKNGRLRGPIVVNTDNVQYESSEAEKHVDLAIRWSHSLGDFDIGTYWFRGTNREPLLTIAQENREPVIHQYYIQMDQLGLDVQATLGDFLWKFETIYRDTNNDDYWATQAGFEYTYVGAFSSNTDVGLLIEHAWDSRGEGSVTEITSSFQNDLYIGTRIAFNDMQSSEILMGIGTDLDHSATSFIFEMTRRFSDNIKASADIRIIQSSEPLEQLYAVKEDDHLQVSVDWYF
jgi:hypothetical protein